LIADDTGWPCCAGRVTFSKKTPAEKPTPPTFSRMSPLARSSAPLEPAKSMTIGSAPPVGIETERPAPAKSMTLPALAPLTSTERLSTDRSMPVTPTSEMPPTLAFSA
jgi:hypothetical protein